MTRYLLALIDILPLISSAEIYKWAYESGHVHFGGKPKDNKYKTHTLAGSVYPKGINQWKNGIKFLSALHMLT